MQLDIRNKDGHVTVTPSDEDRFSIAVEHAVEACQAFHRREDFQKQFALLLRLVAEWLSVRNDIESAWITKRDGHLLFLVVRTRAEYDRGFEDDLSALDLELANDPHLSLVRVSTMGLPRVSKEALQGFVDSEFGLPFQPMQKRGKSR